MAPEGRDVGAHLEHLEDIWRRQSVMKTMGLIPDVLTSGEKFDIGPGSQRNRRTLLSWFNSGVDTGRVYDGSISHAIGLQ